MPSNMFGNPSGLLGALQSQQQYDPYSALGQLQQNSALHMHQHASEIERLRRETQAAVEAREKQAAAERRRARDEELLLLTIDEEITANES